MITLRRTAHWTSLPALALAFSVPQLAGAAVSGFYDSAAQIQVLLTSEDLANALRQQPIESLDFDGVEADGLLKWEVDSKDCDIDAYLKAEAPAGVGATSYTLARISTCS